MKSGILVLANLVILTAEPEAIYLEKNALLFIRNIFGGFNCSHDPIISAFHRDQVKHIFELQFARTIFFTHQCQNFALRWFL